MRELECIHFFIFRNSSLPTYTFNETALPTTSTEPTDDKNKQMNVTVLIAVTLLCVFLIISMAVNIFVLCTKRCKNSMTLNHLTDIWFIWIQTINICWNNHNYIHIFKAYNQLISCYRPKEESNENGDGIKCQDETVSFMQDRDQKSKRSSEIGLYIVFPI